MMITAASAAILLALSGPAAPAGAADGARKAKAQPQRGTASYYAPKFNGRRMANGKRFNPNASNAAHKTLPLGTTAKVTNLENGKSAEVTVEDRGPYARGRIMDVSPRTAAQLDMKKDGTAPVVVEPTRVPDRDERVAGR
ncbi:septal ring lytic transglycosylase RlpA family protein [Dankookia sp. P2]|uniref:septal ring lytic transglycosylase RlpA family protein n=1 Tax=Dankookia sp. P2 TaxID=3423955 RepID=UPI003D66C6B0